MKRVFGREEDNQVPHLTFVRLIGLENLSLGEGPSLVSLGVSGAVGWAKVITSKLLNQFGLSDGRVQ